MEVVLMNNNYFDFKDLMAFGMFILALVRVKFDFKDLMTFGLFILALLTFVFTFCR